MKTYIKNALIIDGTGEKGYAGAVLIEDDKIIRVRNTMEQEAERDADRIIDAQGMVLAPGFIDTHSHSDLKVLSAPELLPKLHQGITTEVLGQDGISMAPLPFQYIEPWKKNLAGLDGTDDQLDWTYRDTAGYLQLIRDAQPARNESYLLPHGNVRMEAMGLDNRVATKEDIQKMCEITRREMEAGCIGLSSGLIYMPCAYGQTEELIEMCKVVAEFGGVFVVHQRSEADDIIPSMDEIIRIGAESNVAIHFSHFKVCGKQNWEKLPAMLQKLDEAAEKGLTVSFDQYPYVAGSTMLGVILPPWVHDGGTDKLVERLKDPVLREQMKQDMIKGIDGWDNFIQFAGTEGIFITSVASQKNQDVVGLSLEELGEKRGKDALDATFDLLAEEKNAVGMVDFYGTEEHVIRIMKRPEMNLCTDGLLSGKPHPRVYGSFPRVLGKYVREEKALTLEEAVRKLSGKAADALHIHHRGYIKEGYYADLCIFDPDTVEDRGTFTKPEQYPAGIRYVFVNGVLELEKGTVNQNRAGKVLCLNSK
ncbi:MAG: D-aminoacylase [Lachnospiraceae bacterium]|nr:D-aminoacylase [Lachnospiraceae bacterium]